MFDCAVYLNDGELRSRAIQMADWEIEVQMASGAVMGGVINKNPTPAVFNTGQVMLGWLRAFQETNDRRYLEACGRAARFLCSAQNDDGTWSKGNSEYADARSTTYNTRVAWAMILLGQNVNEHQYVEAGEKNIEAALRMQEPNGWFRKNCLDNPEAPLLHTICYAIEGIWGVAEALNKDRYRDRAILTVNHLIPNIAEDGKIPGRFDSLWHGGVTWNCLTGSSQLACILLKLYAKSHDKCYQAAARKLIKFVKSTQNCVIDHPGLRGGIKGSFPFDGSYGRYETLNWATKFFIDALLLDEASGNERG
jgi:hypothetical protein